MATHKIYIFALAAHGSGISGGDKIFIEFSRYWSKKIPTYIFVCEEGYRICLRHKLQISNIQFRISNIPLWKGFGFVINYFIRIIEGIKIGLLLRLEDSQNIIIYSASEFWMDSLPAFLLKLRYPKIKWVAAWYQTAPNPFKGFTEGDRRSKYIINSFIYYLVQFPIKPLIKRYADVCLVNNENEKKVFLSKDRRKKAIVVYGAVDLEKIKRWKMRHKNSPKIYDAVFQGRFHPQKGVVELIDIWKLVIRKIPSAILAMIGDGPLMTDVKTRIKELDLEDNIRLFGYLHETGKKYSIFQNSKIVVHPSYYDSGGMASLEAMAFGLPCVGFNLNAYRDYYPKGMLKAEKGNLKDFADKILQLLTHQKEYKKIQKEVSVFITDKFSWRYRSRQILDQVLE